MFASCEVFRKFECKPRPTGLMLPNMALILMPSLIESIVKNCKFGFSLRGNFEDGSKAD